MFKKIVSNIPYSPSLLPQLSFYAKRLKQENITRQLGLIFAGLTIVMQMVLVVASPTPSIAGADNDLIAGGLNINGKEMTHSQAVNKIVTDVYGSSGQKNGLKALFEFYGISEQDVRNSRSTYICSKQDSARSCGPEHNNNRSVGRKPNPVAPSKDVRFTVPGRNEVYYHRPLSIWDSTKSASKYKALEIKPGLYIIYTCANIVFREAPETEVKSSKKILSPSSGTVSAGELLQYEVSISNTGNAPSYDVRISDTLDPNLIGRSASNGGTFLKSGSKERVEWNIGTLQPGAKAIRTFTAEVKQAPAPGKICNKAAINYTTPSGSKKTDYTSNVCKDVKEEPEFVCIDGVVVRVQPGAPGERVNGPAGRDCSVPQPVCRSLTVDSATQALTIPATVTFTANVKRDGTKVEKYEFYVNDQLVKDGVEQTFTTTFDEVNNYTVNAIVYFDDGTVTDASSCESTITATETPNERVDQNKTARIVAGHSPLEEYTADSRGRDVSDQTVSAGEIIEYTITVQNTGNTTFEDYALPKEDMRDVLEYADIVDSDGNAITAPEAYTSPIEILGGGTLEDGSISWRNEDKFTPGEIIPKTFYVVVKDPVPSTNQVASVPYSYDCTIVNTYSNSIAINVNCPIEKQIEQNIETLPKTGPGETAAVTFFFGSLGLYFYNRNKQLLRESKIVSKMFSGGM